MRAACRPSRPASRWTRLLTAASTRSPRMTRSAASPKCSIRTRPPGAGSAIRPADLDPGSGERVADRRRDGRGARRIAVDAQRRGRYRDDGPAEGRDPGVSRDADGLGGGPIGVVEERTWQPARPEPAVGLVRAVGEPLRHADQAGRDPGNEHRGPGWTDEPELRIEAGDRPRNRDGHERIRRGAVIQGAVTDPFV